MVTLLSKIFIKEDMDENKKRSLYGFICGILGILLNILLALGKILAGTLTGSIAVSADGFNNLSDAGSAIVTLLGFKIAGAKPDARHPYGHGRVEYMAGLLVAVLILAMAISLAKESINKIIHPQKTEFSVLVVVVLIASILVKFYMSFYNRKVGKKINSVAILATSLDSLTDCIATAVVLISTLVSYFFKIEIDGYSGFAVSLFVAYAGFSALRDTLNPLLGQPPTKEFVDKVKDIAMNFDEKIIGVHDLIVHDYGPGRVFITIHAEMPADEDVLVLHEITDALEQELTTKLNCLATVHLDPIVTNDEETNKLKDGVQKIIEGIDKNFTFHDFRIVPGENRTNILFDIVVPISLNVSDEEIADEIGKKIKDELGKKYFAVIQVDRNMGVIE